LLRFAGSAIRTQDLFSNKDIFAKATSFITSGIKGVEVKKQRRFLLYFFANFVLFQNIYTQHQPLLRKTLDNVRKQRLKPNEFPICGAAQPADQAVRQV